MNFKNKKKYLIGLTLFLSGLFFLVSVSPVSAASCLKNKNSFSFSSFLNPLASLAEKVVKDFGYEVVLAANPGDVFPGANCGSVTVGCSGTLPTATISSPAAPDAFYTGCTSGNGTLPANFHHYILAVGSKIYPPILAVGSAIYPIAPDISYPVLSSDLISMNCSIAPGCSWSVEAYYNILSWPPTSSATLCVTEQPFGSFTTPNCAPACTGSISASPNPCCIPNGGSTCGSTITWSSQNCPSGAKVLAGGSLFSSNSSGSQATGDWIGTTPAIFDLINNADNSKLASVSVPGSLSTADIKANNSDGPVSVTYDTPATISWTSSNVSSCSVSPSGWTGTSNSGISTGNLTSSQTYTLTCNRNDACGTISDNVTVTVSPPSAYTLSVTKAGTGSGTVTGTGISCGSDCSENYTSGTSVTLTATADSCSSTAVSWLNCDSVSGNHCTVMMNTNKTVTATFNLVSPGSPTLVAPANGLNLGIAPQTPTFSWNDVNCESGYWVDVCTDSNCANYTNKNVSANIAQTTWNSSLSAGTYWWRVYAYNNAGGVHSTIWSFSVGTISTYTLSVTKAGTGSGTVTGTGISCGSDCSETYTSGTSVTLTAAADTGSTFAGFGTTCANAGGTISGSQCLNIPMNVNKSVTATFNTAVTCVGVGSGTGLTGKYYNGINFNTLITTRNDSTIDFDPADYLGVSYANSPNGNTFSVRWEGQVEARCSETYTFYTRSDDGVRLWVNSVQIVNNWTDHGPTENSGTIALTAGQKYDIKMEYYESGGGAVAQLNWSSLSAAKQIIPSAQLYSSAVPTLSVIITANPMSGVAPLNTTLTANVSGTAAGNINYSFWWNCDNNTTSIASASSACGNLPAPVSGTCVTNASGAKCDNINTTSKSTNHTYSSDGSYRPKVIVERDVAPAAQDLVDALGLPDTPGDGPGPCTIDCIIITSCGDGSCNGTETCSTCPVDCGACPLSTYTLSVSKAGTGSGTVTGPVGTQDGINCGTNCTENYNSGTNITINATPITGSSFAGFGTTCANAGGTVSGNQCLNIPMNANKTVTATFNVIPPDFSLDSSNTIYATLVQGQPGNSSATALTIFPFYGFSSNVSLSVQSVGPSLPGGSTFNFSRTSLNSSQYSSGSQFSVHIGAGLNASQTYTITIKAVDGGLVRTTNVLLNAQVQNPDWREI